MQDFCKEREVKMAIKTMQSEPHPFVQARNVDTCKTGDQALITLLQSPTNLQYVHW